MIGGPNTTINNLASIYVSNDTAIAQAMARIASGKRVQVPSDDFAGYLKASDLQNDIDGYTNIKAGLQNAQGLTDYAKTTGNQILEDLTHMKSLATQWATANAANANDTDTLNGYKAQYDAIVSGISDLKVNASYNGTTVYAAGPLGTFGVNAENSALTMDITTTNVANEAAVNNIASANAVTDIEHQIAEGEKYVAQVSSAGTEVTSFMTLADVAVSSKQAAMSAITDIDEAHEMATLTNLQIRQEATVSMFAQANIIQGYAAKLYGGINT